MTRKDRIAKALATQAPADRSRYAEARRRGLALIFLANGAGVLLALAVAAILRF